jgi:hypothetical protein
MRRRVRPTWSGRPRSPSAVRLRRHSPRREARLQEGAGGAREARGRDRAPGGAVREAASAHQGVAPRAPHGAQEEALARQGAAQRPRPRPALRHRPRVTLPPLRDRPRKEGGGYGNVGNVKDLRAPEKYLKEGEEPEADRPAEETAAEQAEQRAPEQAEPEKPTLEEYYRAKGLDLSYQPASRPQPKKEAAETAEWIKKEKLTLLTTKEDLKAQERSGQQAVKPKAARSGLDIEEADLGKVGFGSKPVAPREAPRTEEKRGEKRIPAGKKGGKPQFSAEDFPSL